MGAALAKLTAAMTTALRRPRLRILCFGDSLTAGYASYGAVHHPYEEKLEQMLAMAFPDLRVETVEDGVSGATVKYQFQTRMNAQFMAPKGKKKAKSKSKESGEEEEEDEKRYDWAIVLGGTNDLGLSIPAEDIFEALKEVWEVPLERKCKVLALTVPECGVTGKIKERLDAKRDTLNGLIKGYKKEGFHVFDLQKAIPYWSMAEADREKYWDDGLHLTPDGYDLMGNKIGIALVSILAAERAASGSGSGRPPKRRRMFRDDDARFAEEAGDPAAIDQGYVVVRRADLE